MELKDLTAYTAELANLEKFDAKVVRDEYGLLEVIETKETYVYESEDEADNKINESRQNPLFAAATKKYKAGKLNKAGEVVKNETWTVVIKLNH